VKIGLFGINIGVASEPDAIVRVAKVAEAAGLESVWTGEHVVLPDPQVRPSPSAPQSPFLDPAVALTYVAAHTERIRLGTGIIILPQRNPLVLAKELASLDVLSKGRLLFGVGAGYLEPEFRALGAPFEDRGAVTDEAIEVMRALWTLKEPSYQGRFFSFKGIDAYPRPVQKPHPPIIVGGISPLGARRAVRYGHGWYGFLTDPEATKKVIGWIQASVARGERGAGLGEVEISVTPPPPITADTVKRYEDLGVKRLIALGLPPTLDATLRLIDGLGPLAG
jgi:probable F420-dependent oxidoreductase